MDGRFLSWRSLCSSNTSNTSSVSPPIPTTTHNPTVNPLLLRNMCRMHFLCILSVHERQKFGACCLEIAEWEQIEKIEYPSPLHCPNQRWKPAQISGICSLSGTFQKTHTLASLSWKSNTKPFWEYQYRRKHEQRWPWQNIHAQKVDVASKEGNGSSVTDCRRDWRAVLLPAVRLNERWTILPTSPYSSLILLHIRPSLLLDVASPPSLFLADSDSNN